MEIRTRAETRKSTHAAATKASWELAEFCRREALALGLLEAQFLRSVTSFPPEGAGLGTDPLVSLE